VNVLNDTALLLGRIAIAALFLPSGITKAFHFAGFVEQLVQHGVPYATLVAGIAIAAEIGGAAALVAGIAPRPTAVLLIAFTVVATAVSHRYWTFEGAARRGQEINFYKNVAIIGGFLFYGVCGPGRIRIRLG
jgi:putative oxidoreductase